jgi:hypothetical protein
VMRRRSFALIAISVLMAFAIAIATLRTRGIQATESAVAVGRQVQASSHLPVEVPSVGRSGSAEHAESKADSDIDGNPKWSTAFFHRRDVYEFVTRAAESALAGDGEAAYYVAQSVMRCFGRERDAWNAADPEAAFVAKWAKYPNDHFAIENDRKLMQDCLRYVRADAFVALPPRVGGYNDPGFWNSRAYGSGNPRALAQHTLLALGGLTDATSATNASVIDTAEADMHTVLTSGDLGAMFDLGLVFDSPANRTSGDQGIVVRLAACDLGFDCTTGNPAVRDWMGCFSQDNCSEITEFQDIVRQGLPASMYADAFARAQELANAVRRGDTDYLRQFARVRRVR